MSSTRPGRWSSSVHLTKFSGSYDPGAPTSDQPQLVDARAVGTTDGRYRSSAGRAATARLVGWSAWTCSTLSTLSMTGTASTRIGAGVTVRGKTPTRNAPAVSLSPSGASILVSSTWYVEDPTDPAPPSGTDHWVTTLSNGRLGSLGEVAGSPGSLTPAGTSDAADCAEFERGLIDDATYYTVCWKTASGFARISRHNIDGSLIDSADLPRDDGESASFFTRTEDALFAWDPFGPSMVRYDFVTAAVTQARATPATSTAPGDVLASLGRRVGRWISPSVLAKVNIEPGAVASTDGTRIYALGIGGPDGGAGSTGVYAFDAKTLDVLDAGRRLPTSPRSR